LRIISGPIMNEISNAVMADSTVRNVM